MIIYASFMLLWTILGTIGAIVVCRGVEPENGIIKEPLQKLQKAFFTGFL
jgi:hypothetical protein